MKRLQTSELTALATKNGYEYKALAAVTDVESDGSGFSDTTGKIVIQFEPMWFRRKAPALYTKYLGLLARSRNNMMLKEAEKVFLTTYSIIINNGVQGQTAEWVAFNAAYSLNANAAMESTSIGMMQVMGFHYKSLGFKTVGEMWDYAKVSEANQVDLAIRFIKLNPKLDKALKLKDWQAFAYYYNGELYKKYKYDTRLAAAYKN